MSTASFSPKRRSLARLAPLTLGALLVFALLSGNLPADPAPADTGSGSFGQYLTDHQADLAPFFDKNSGALTGEALRAIFGLAGEILLVVLAAGWFLDVILSRAFSTIAAPAYTQISRSLIYASGRLVLSFALTILIGLALLVGLNFFGAGMATLLLLAVLSLVALFMQMSWVSYLYRSSLTAAALFYVALLVIHAVLISLVAPIFLSSPVHMAIANYVDQSVTPRLRQEAEAVRRDAAMTSGPAAAVKAQAAELEARISQARTEQQNLQEAIKVGKDSADVVFDRLVKLRAEGSLAEARAQFAAFLQWFPNGPRAETARGQLSEIDKALAAQAELKQEQQADADRAAAAARARLLARAAAGQVTLSEMRAALLGKTPAEVNALFGAPTETASNRWGYGQRMIFNALDNTHLGLTVVFADGVVQGVDYYYGSAP